MTIHQPHGQVPPVRVGIIGYGFIGQHAVRSILGGGPAESGLQLAFVHTRQAAKLADLPAELRLADLADWRRHGADLIVECAHPGVTRQYGADFLTSADYLPLSVNALGDAEVERALLEASRQSGRRLLIPHGALIGLDNLVEGAGQWAEALISFRKHPRNIDFAETDIDPASITSETVVYEGPVRAITRLFPRNVNTMATFALATTGLDHCTARLIADPSLNVAIAEVRAVGKDGSIHESRKVQPVVGVSGTEMLAAQMASIRRAAGVRLPGLQFV
jgi:aspartate dehydrogenase